MILTVVSLVAGVAGVLFGARCYIELRRWARLMQGAQIAVAHKRKTVLTAPLQEWALWCRNLEAGEQTGRVVYQNASTRVAVIQRPKQGRPKLSIRRKSKVAAPAPVREGRWAARDETKRETA